MAGSTSRKTLLGDITRSYSPIESWIYDRMVADAVRTMSRGLVAAVADVADDGGAILDVGCGGGQLACELAERFPAALVTGVDASAEQIGRARRRAEKFGSQVEFRTGLAGELPFADNAFDAVVSGGSIKHWPDRAAGLVDMIRVVRPGGMLAVGELDRGCTLADARAFVAQWRMPRLTRGLGLLVFRTHGAGQSLTGDEFHELVHGTGLENVVVERLSGLPSLQLTASKRVRTERRSALV